MMQKGVSEGRNESIYLILRSLAIYRLFIQVLDISFSLFSFKSVAWFIHFLNGDLMMDRRLVLQSMGLKTQTELN